MNDGLTIKSVRHADGKTSIEYRVRTDHGNDEIALETEDEPHPDFTAAFESLAGDVAVLCEIPLDPERPITVRKIAFKDKSGRFGAVLTGLRDLTGGPGAVTLNTPVRYAAGIGGEAAGDGAAPSGDAFDADQVERLRTMETEARAFIRGKRAQGDLFHQGEDAAGSLAAPAEDRQAEPDTDSGDEEAAQAEVSFDEEAAAETQQALSTMTEAQKKLLCDVRASLAYERLKGPRKRIFKGLKDRGLVVVAGGQVTPSELGHHVLALLDEEDTS